MRKSSLGRRSSTQIPIRVPSIGGSSGQKLISCSGGKKSSGSKLKQPGFTQRYRRSQSEDRESYGGRSMPGSLVRSNTFGALTGRSIGAMTPITPRVSSVHSNLPTGSVRAPRNQTVSTESNRRLSSFGGTKRKDSRPITEKAFQQAAQAKVQQYFETHGPEVIGPGNSIRRMNTKLFVDMMDHLFKNFDSRIVITKSNFLEELLNLLRKFGYRSKVDRSWLMTVNTTLSWQHVIAVLSWLVEAIECMNCVDAVDIMYPNNIGDEEEEDEDPESIKIDKEVVSYIKKTYRKWLEDRSVDNDNVLFVTMDAEYIEKQIIEEKCADEDFEVLQREIDLVREEVENEIKRKDLQLEEYEKLQTKHNALQNDCQTIESYIEQSKQFVETTKVKLMSLDQEIAIKKKILAKKMEELQKLQEKVNSQQISLNEKETFSKEKHDLQRMINFYENGIREYENSAFGVDIKLAEDQRKIEKLIVEYNKLVAENIIAEPRLKEVEVKFTFMSQLEETQMDIVDNNLKNLKEEYKKSVHALQSRLEEAENVLWRVKQDKKETEEELSKETTLLEGVECDLEKQQELIAKESQKLKDEHQRYQKLTKEIVQEMTQFDPAKLDDKKLELKKMEHDWELLQKRTEQFFEGYSNINREVYEKIRVSVAKLNQTTTDFEKKHL